MSQQPDPALDPLGDPLGEDLPEDHSMVGPEQAPPEVDTSPTQDDGPQDVDQEPGYEEAESDDNDAEDDPEVHDIA